MFEINHGGMGKVYIYMEDYPKSLKKCSKSIHGGMGESMFLIVKNYFCNEPGNSIYIYKENI